MSIKFDSYEWSSMCHRTLNNKQQSRQCAHEFYFGIDLGFFLSFPFNWMPSDDDTNFRFTNKRNRIEWNGEREEIIGIRVLAYEKQIKNGKFILWSSRNVRMPLHWPIVCLINSALCCECKTKSHFIIFWFCCSLCSLFTHQQTTIYSSHLQILTANSIQRQHM